MEVKNKKNIDLLIAEYLTGNMDANRFNLLKEWSMENDENLNYVKQMVKTWLVTSPAETKKEQALQHTMDKIKAKRHVAWYAQHRFWMNAAAITLLILLPIFGYWLGHDNNVGTQGKVIVKTEEGARTSIILPDSSEVWLNQGSSLAYAQSFNTTNRDVHLDGEALFDVKHNADKPFVVHTGKLSVKVLGTRFTVKNYGKEKTSEVNLIRGHVEVDDTKGQQVRLNANQKVTYDKNNGTMTVADINGDNVARWQNGELFFDNTPLEDIASQLSHVYHAHVTVSSEAKEITFYGKIVPQTTTLESALHTICSTNMVKLKQENGKYILYK